MLKCLKVYIVQETTPMTTGIGLRFRKNMLRLWSSTDMGSNLSSPTNSCVTLTRTTHLTKLQLPHPLMSAWPWHLFLMLSLETVFLCLALAIPELALQNNLASNSETLLPLPQVLGLKACVTITQLTVFHGLSMSNLFFVIYELWALQSPGCLSGIPMIICRSLCHLIALERLSRDACCGLSAQSFILDTDIFVLLSICSPVRMLRFFPEEVGAGNKLAISLLCPDGQVLTTW